MRGTPWKVLFALSVLLTLAGCGVLVWSGWVSAGWSGAAIGMFVILIGGLLARMNYRAYRYAIIPGAGTTLPIVGVSVCALLWIMIAVGAL